MVRDMAAENPVHYAQFHPGDPVGDGVFFLDLFFNPSVRRDGKDQVRLAEGVVFLAAQLAQTIGGALFQVGQHQLAPGVRDHRHTAAALPGQPEGSPLQPDGGIQFIRYLEQYRGFLTGDLMHRGLHPGLFLFHRDFHRFGIGGIILGHSGLGQDIVPQVQLDALAVAGAVAEDLVHRLPGGVPQGAVLGHNVLSGGDVIDAPGHRLTGVGVDHPDSDDIFRGGKRDHHHQGLVPVPVLVGDKPDVAGGVIALRLVQLVEEILPQLDLFRQEKDALAGGLVLPVFDPAGVIGVEELKPAVLGVQFKPDACLLDGGLGLRVDHHDIDRCLAIALSLAVAASAAGHRVFIFVLVVVAAATSAVVVPLAVAVPGAGFVVLPAAIFGAAARQTGGGTRVGVNQLFLRDLDDIEQQEHDHQQQNQQQSRHHVGGGLPVVEGLAARFFSQFTHNLTSFSNSCKDIGLCR